MRLQGYKIKLSKGKRYTTFLIALLHLLLSCEEFVQIDPPRTDLIKVTTFATDATANAAMLDVYYEMGLVGFVSGSNSSITYLATLSSDEQISNSAIQVKQFEENELSADNSYVLSLWSEMYKSIYKVNAILEGVAGSNTLSTALKTQLEGEAKFIRAFCHFYLVNLFGDVPIVTTTDYRGNADIRRAPTTEVYDQIVSDLRDAQSLLPDDYAFAKNERVRVNKSVATALLARVFLHIKDWQHAEVEATKIIDNPVYALVEDLNSVFLKNSTEAIFQFHCAETNRPGEYFTFRVFAEDGGPIDGAFRPGFVNNFESDDLRLQNWVRSVVAGNTTYYFPGKYKVFTRGAEYTTLLRLAEIYLIRAEARAYLDKIQVAQHDLNMVRHRAGLPDTMADDKNSLLLAIEHERVVELFTEQGIRWLDLKRTGRVDALLGPIKGSAWKPTDVLFPIPQYQILNNSEITNAQNPGY